MRESGDSKYDHLNEDLHVLVEAKGNENLAAARLAAGVAEVRKMLIPGVSTEYTVHCSFDVVSVVPEISLCLSVCESARGSFFVFGGVCVFLPILAKALSSLQVLLTFHPI